MRRRLHPGQTGVYGGVVLANGGVALSAPSVRAAANVAAFATAFAPANPERLA
jgi:hypothetical protein